MNKTTNRRKFFVSAGILSALAFTVTLFLGIGISSAGHFSKLAPFMGLIFVMIFMISKGSCCSRKRC